MSGRADELIDSLTAYRFNILFSSNRFNRFNSLNSFNSLTVKQSLEDWRRIETERAAAYRKPEKGRKIGLKL